VKLDRHAFDSQAVRPYFEVQRVVDGALGVCARLFGLEFRKASVRGWHPSVLFFDVYRGEDGRVGRLFFDLYARPDKATGNFLSTEFVGLGGVSLPSTGVVTTVPGPSKPGSPALLEHRQVLTLFHELGHALEELAGASQRFSRLGNGSEEPDFGEVTSQLLEEWAWDPDVLAGFARRVDTDGPIPRELVLRMRAASEFGKGLLTQSYLFTSMVGTGLQAGAPRETVSDEWVKGISDRYAPFPLVEGTHPHVSHFYVLNPATQFHVYLLSKVVAKDLASRFLREGLSNPVPARDYWDRFLVPAGLTPAKDKVAAFLGRPQASDAYLEWLAGSR